MSFHTATFLSVLAWSGPCLDASPCGLYIQKKKSDRPLRRDVLVLSRESVCAKGHRSKPRRCRVRLVDCPPRLVVAGRVAPRRLSISQYHSHRNTLSTSRNRRLHDTTHTDAHATRRRDAEPTRRAPTSRPLPSAHIFSHAEFCTCTHARNPSAVCLTVPRLRRHHARVTLCVSRLAPPADAPSSRDVR